MQYPLGILQVAGVVAVTQSLLLALALGLGRSKARPADAVLAASFGTFSAVVAAFVVLSLGPPRPLYEVATVVTTLSFGVGPLLFMYVRSLRSAELRPRFRDIPSFAFTIAAAVTTALALGLTDDLRVSRYWVPLFVSGAVIVHNGIHFVRALRLRPNSRLSLRGGILAGEQAGWLPIFLLAYLVEVLRAMSKSGPQSK